MQKNIQNTMTKGVKSKKEIELEKKIKRGVMEEKREVSIGKLFEKFVEKNF